MPELARTLMVQGTASHAGKSTVVAALCRAIARRGYRVAPFKAQNMSLNSAVTVLGEEMGRSQAFQAEACGIEPEVSMNPLLLKPMPGGRCEVIVRGRSYAVVEAFADPDRPLQALRIIQESLEDLRSRFEVVILEGMGSPAEINLRDRDVANMRTAALADAPVLLVGDIERGGVFASLAGTTALLLPDDRDRLAGYLINKFHGDPAVLASGLAELEDRFGVPTLGVLPYRPDFAAALQRAEEDAVSLDGQGPAPAAFDIVAPRFPTLSNCTDLAPLAAEPGVSVRCVKRSDEWGDPALVVLPGTRHTSDDLEWLREVGLARRIIEHAEKGGWVVGLCGGYQMLGRWIDDPHGIETPGRGRGSVPVQGLGLLDVATVLGPRKHLSRVRGISLLPGFHGLAVEGYEIHHGVTTRGPAVLPVFQLQERPGQTEEETDGAADSSGRVFGTYLHGLFDSAPFRRGFLERLGYRGHTSDPLSQPSLLDELADWIEGHTQFQRILGFIGGITASGEP